LIFSILIALGNGIVGLGAVGAGIYAFLNRLLIPTGLHHALNNVFWFDTIGLGDLSHFWAGETSADVTWSLGMYMSGFFPCMMFGIPGAALAMIQCAKTKKKKIAIGLLSSAALCAFICGVTEPFEFAFMFLAPGLYLIYALLYGIFTTITVALGFRAGFCFSAGATDLLFSASLPAAAKTWLIIPLGIAAFVVFYAVFRFAILKFDLKTPGREDDDDEEAELNAVLANNNYTEVAKIVLEGIGGKDNVISLDNCVTRLRFEIKDYTAVDEKKIKSAGVAGIVRPGKKSVQVIVGTKVQFVADELKKMC
jgi:PTS system N-acetylglucosamine-specific IIC component